MISQVALLVQKLFQTKKQQESEQQQQTVAQVSQALLQKQQEYLKQNPEVEKQLVEFLNNLTLKKPTNLVQFGINHFQTQKYTPMVLTGPSGAGKGTIINYLLKQYPETFSLSISLTTRQPRNGEEHGVHYYFVEIDEFKKEIEKNSFAEYCEVHGNYYGTHLEKLYGITDSKRIPILDIDVQGGEKIHQQFPNWNYVFINLPSLEEQEKRLRARNTETEDQLQRRLKNATKEINRLRELTYYEEIVNDELEQTQDKFDNYIQKKYSSVVAVAQQQQQ